MASAYDTGSADTTLYGSGHEVVLPYIPIEDNLKDGSRVQIDFVRTDTEANCVMLLLNEAIEDGESWPFEQQLSKRQFQNYFFAHTALVVKNNTGEVIGAFYCKPNFPERCSHFCNGGFITNKQYRRRGVAMCMGRAFLRIARDLGFQASLFNLVFTHNVASVRLWEKLGFTKLAVLPRVGRLKSGYSDAIQFYYNLQDEQEGRNPFWTRARSFLRRPWPLVCIASAVLLSRKLG